MCLWLMNDAEVQLGAIGCIFTAVRGYGAHQVRFPFLLNTYVN